MKNKKLQLYEDWKFNNIDKDEFIKYVTCHYDEALYLMEQGYINDSNSIITLEKSKKYVKELGGIK